MNADPDGMPGETPAELAARLGLRFKSALLLTRALTHRSFLNEHREALEDNERLEFLGDAVLDFLTGAWLYNRYPEMPEGDLTRMRAALVCTEQLAEFARELKIGGAMRLGRGESHAGGRERDVLLCATFEALVGALYLSNGLQDVDQFLNPLLDRTPADWIIQKEIHDPKSRLQEWSQGCKMGIPRYSTVETSGPDHGRIFIVEVEVNGKAYARGQGSSKQSAERDAAHLALEKIDHEESR